MSGVRRIAPVFPVSDLAAAVDHYRRLGFATREYEAGGYAYAVRDSVEIHLSEMDGLDPKTSMSVAYLWVDDADALAAEWVAAGARVVAPRDTEWRQHEGAHIDPDGNLLRFGSPIRDVAT